jgi:hypothetical protein
VSAGGLNPALPRASFRFHGIFQGIWRFPAAGDFQLLWGSIGGRNPIEGFADPDGDAKIDQNRFVRAALYQWVTKNDVVDFDVVMRVQLLMDFRQDFRDLHRDSHRFTGAYFAGCFQMPFQRRTVKKLHGVVGRISWEIHSHRDIAGLALPVHPHQLDHPGDILQAPEGFDFVIEFGAVEWVARFIRPGDFYRYLIPPRGDGPDNNRHAARADDILNHKL